MSNPDRRVPNSETRGSTGEGFFVDITPPEFGEKRLGQNPTSHQQTTVPVSPEVPNVPGQPTFVERRATPASTKDSNGLFFRTPKIKPSEEVDKSELVADLESTDEIPSVPDRIPLSGEEPNDADPSSPMQAPQADAQQAEPAEEHPSESITQDIPYPAAPGSEHPTDQLDVIDPATARPPDDNSPEAQATRASQPATTDETADQSPDERTLNLPEAAENASTSASADESNEDLSPAQVQLAELRAMLSKMSKPTQQPSSEVAEPTTHEHPIGDELQAKLDSGEPDETAIEILPKDGGRQQLPPPPPVRPSIPYFPTPEQKKAHARFLPPDTRPRTNSEPLQLSTPANDLYGPQERIDSPPPPQSIPLMPPNADDNDAASAANPEITGRYEAISVEGLDHSGATAGDDESSNRINGTADDSTTGGVQRDGFFDNLDSGAKPDSGSPIADTGVEADQQLVVGNASSDYDDDHRRPRRPVDRQRDYQTVDSRSGEYDYDHEYYAANQANQSRRQLSPNGGADGRSDSVENRSADHNWAPVAPGRRPENANGSRASDAVDRLRIGRVIFLFLIAGVIGGFWWANSTGLINLSELTDLVSDSETTENSTNLSDDEQDDPSDSSSPGQDSAAEDESLGLAQPEPSETLNVAESGETSESVSEVRLLIQAKSVDGDPMPGVPIEVVTSEDSKVLARVETSITGIATYYSDNPGCYRIQVQTPAGWVLDDPTDGEFASICGEDSHSSEFKAVFRPAATAAPDYCEVQTSGLPKPRVIVAEGDSGYADSYTLYDRFGRKLAETQDPTPDEVPGQAVLEWPPTVDFATGEIVALSATAGGEESLPTPCDLAPA